MNNLTVSGRLGRDPELRSTQSGQSVCNFSLAVNRFKKDDPPIWFDVSVWGAQGENVNRFLSKGSEAVIAGEVDVRTYQKNDGTTGVSLTINARQVTFVGGRSDNDGGGSNGFAPQAAQAPAPAQAPADDDIPF
jgi:single-strand DNA-binding protein